MHNQNNSVSLKLYNREPRSTIDAYKNGENTYIYSKQQQQQKQDTVLKTLCLHVFWQSAHAESGRSCTQDRRYQILDCPAADESTSFRPLLDFLFMVEMMPNHQQQPQ